MAGVERGTIGVEDCRIEVGLHVVDRTGYEVEAQEGVGVEIVEEICFGESAEVKLAEESDSAYCRNCHFRKRG